MVQNVLSKMLEKRVGEGMSKIVDRMVERMKVVW